MGLYTYTRTLNMYSVIKSHKLGLYSLLVYLLRVYLFRPKCKWASFCIWYIDVNQTEST